MVIVKTNFWGKDIIQKDTCWFCGEETDCFISDGYEIFDELTPICKLCRRYKDLQDEQYVMEKSEKRKNGWGEYKEERDKFLDERDELI